MFKKFLPLSIEGDWRANVSALPDAIVSPILLNWLFENGSLTQKLKSHCNEFSVKVLAKHQRFMTPCEINTMLAAEHKGSDADFAKQLVQVREVLLYCDDVPWVYAQTIMPLTDVPCSVEQLIVLGEKPLGEIIFNQPGVKRSDIEVVYFEPDAQVCQLALQLNQSVEHGLCGRRSMFSLDGYSLLVAEIFLPFSGLYS